MTKPFDYVNSISYTKKDLMTGTENDELAEAGYIPFLTNRALANHLDTVLYAQEMNMNHHLDNKLQYSYLLNTIRPSKRFAKWAKKEVNSDLDAVREYYGYSYDKAKAVLQILTPDQIRIIKQKLEKGGVK